jgi:DNA adenine methylase
MSIPHPIPYQGSKRKLASVILAALPSQVDRLIEPFAGSAAVALAAIYYGKAQHILLNDLNTPLIRLWQAIIEEPEQLAAAYQQLWQAQQGQEKIFYSQIRDRFNQTQQPADFLYLLARCVKAAVRYNTNGQFNQSPDNRRKGAHPDTMKERILAASKLLNNKVMLCTGDYRDVLREVSSQDVIYFDPPYQGVCSKRDPRYIGGLTYENFVETLAELNDRNIAYLVSYDGYSGSKTYGQPLPESLDLQHIEINAGRSSQGTLLGRAVDTVESLYLSPALLARSGNLPLHVVAVRQPVLFW